MNESGFPSFPAGANPPGQSARSAPASEPNARLIGIVPENIREEIQITRRPLRVQGIVVAHNRDGSVRVQTPRGDIDIRPREGQPLPREGQQVEIEIQPNRRPDQPPEAATLRPAPRGSENPAPSRPTTTPVEVQVRPQGEAPKAETATPRPVEDLHAAPRPQTTSPVPSSPLPPEGSIVRLQPLPSNAALPAAIPLEQIISAITQSAEFKTQIITLNVESEIQNTALSPLKTTAPPAQKITTLQIAAAPSPASEILTAQPAQISTAPLTPPPILTAPSPQSVGVQLDPAILQPALYPLPQISVAIPKIVAPNNPLQIPAALFSAPVVQPAIPHTALIKNRPLDVRIEGFTTTPPLIRPDGLTAIPAIPGTTDLPVRQKAGPKTIADSPPLILQNHKAGQIIGIITAITADKLPLVRVYFPQIGTDQLFTLQFPSNPAALTIGTQIQITPQIPGAPQQTTLANILPNVPLPILLAPGPWPFLDEAARILEQSAMPQITQTLANISPSPANPVRMGPAILFFIAALRGGDLTQWLGDKAGDILRRDGRNLLGRLTQEGTTLNRLSAEPLSQDWRAVNLPLYWDGAFQKIALYYKHDRNENDEQPDHKNGATRFVFDLALERMGKVQLDGLYRPLSELGPRLDLVVRTEQAFAQNPQAEMRRIYTRALRDTGITGELSFQNQPGQWVTIQAAKQTALGVSA